MSSGEAPERTLWLCPLGNAWWECEPSYPGGAAYVSLAHAEAMVAAERERCAGIARGFPWPNFLPDTGRMKSSSSSKTRGPFARPLPEMLTQAVPLGFAPLKKPCGNWMKRENSARIRRCSAS